MHKKLFLIQAVEAKHRGGLLGAHYDCFVEWMRERGYARETMRYNVQRVTHFGKYLQQRGIHCIRKLEGHEGERLLTQYEKYWKGRGHWCRNRGLRLYIRSLETSGVIKTSGSNEAALSPEVEEYVEFLYEQKGLAKNTIRYHRDWTEKFLKSLGAQKEGYAWDTLSITDIDRFIEQEGTRQKRTTHQLLVGCLKSFVRFLYQAEKIPVDLSSAMTRPRCYKLGSLPHVLDWSEVKRLLQSVDRSTQVGRQHYGILILLTTYGLRAGEVAGLRLEDIDWKNERVSIRPGKTGRELCLPLMPEVSKAILSYLKYARPTSKFRELFLITCAPWTPITSSHVGYVVRRHMGLAKLNSPKRGPHLLRHSVATRLIRQGASLKEIGDLYGHQVPESTHIYTKTATENLREVALEAPEVT
jgi:site-specific recombinase XerD